MADTPQSGVDTRDADDGTKPETFGAESLEVIFAVEDRGEIHSVHVVGDFNGWSRTAHLMTQCGDRHEIAIRLPVGQRYRYHFLIDGTRWENDWHADDYEMNETGAFVSVVDVTTACRLPLS